VPSAAAVVGGCTGGTAVTVVDGWTGGTVVTLVGGLSTMVVDDAGVDVTVVGTSAPEGSARWRRGWRWRWW
jgi:hypothetical protein